METAKQAQQVGRPSSQHLSSTLIQIRDVLTHLRDDWYQASVTNQEKKELLRCVIERVTLAKQATGKVIRAEICGLGGATSTVEVPKYLYSAPPLFHRITELARELPDEQIAEALTTQGLETVKGRPWSARRVMDFRLSNGIPCGFTVNPRLRLPENGYLTTAEAAARLEIHHTTVQKWYKLGLLSGKHAGGQKALWIEWTAEAQGRLGGQASFDPRMTSIKSLCKLQGKTWEQVIRWGVEEGHQISRLRRGTTFRFYVLPASCSLQP